MQKQRQAKQMIGTKLVAAYNNKVVIKYVMWYDNKIRYVGWFKYVKQIGHMLVIVHYLGQRLFKI